MDELEVRLERLRALYDQYFLGIEKLEPLIARKDVDRRIYVLRREKIRNTGRRFKFQTLVQRYNTFQQYWQRVVREIENGTYRRHVLRAERTVGPTELLTVAARRRFGKERANKQELEESSAPRALDAQREPESDAREPGSPALNETQRPAPAPRRAKTQPPQSLESLELDMDFMGDWDPAALASAPRPAPPPAAAPQPIPQPPPAPRTRPFNPAPTRPQASPPPRQPAPEPSNLSDPRARPLAPPPKPTERQPDPPAPAAPAPSPAAPVPAPPPPSPPAAAAAASPPAGEGARPPRRRQRSTHPGIGPAPAGTPGPQAPSAARSAATPSALNEERLRALHSKLLEESRRANAPEVTLASMAKSLRAVEAKLRQEHGASRRIDFEVILRNGKPAIKPIVR